MYTLLKLKSKKSSRRQIDIKGAKDGILLLPNNRYRSILKVSSLNFELKSEEEQDILIDTYESFLNSLGGPLQVLIRTREVDMDKYITAADLLRVYKRACFNKQNSDPPLLYNCSIRLSFKIRFQDGKRAIEV
jgi:hypothetical protein